MITYTHFDTFNAFSFAASPGLNDFPDGTCTAPSSGNGVIQIIFLYVLSVYKNNIVIVKCIVLNMDISMLYKCN